MYQRQLEFGEAVKRALTVNYCNFEAPCFTLGVLVVFTFRRGSKRNYLCRILLERHCRTHRQRYFQPCMFSPEPRACRASSPRHRQIRLVYLYLSHPRCRLDSYNYLACKRERPHPQHVWPRSQHG